MKRRDSWEVEKLSEPGFMGFSGLGIGVRNPSHNRTTLNNSVSRESEFPPTKLGIEVRNPSHKRVPYKSEGVGNRSSLLQKMGNLKLYLTFLRK